MKKKYRKLKKAIISGASSAIATGIILMGSSNVALAETLDSHYSERSAPTGMQMMHHWNSNGIAGTLGLNKDEIKQELRSGKTMKQILQQNNIVPSEVSQEFAPKRGMKKGWKNNS